MLQACEAGCLRLKTADGANECRVGGFDERRIERDLCRRKDGRPDRSPEERSLESERRLRVPAVRNEVVHDGTRAGRFAPNGDMARITTKLGDMLLDPLKGELLQGGKGSAPTLLAIRQRRSRQISHLVEQSSVQHALVGHFLSRKEAKSPEAILKSDNNEVVPSVDDKVGKIAAIGGRADRVTW